MTTTILVVDDDDAARETMAAELEGAGHTVLRAGSATMAMRLSLREPPRLVVMDLVLPDFHGIEAAGAIRAVAGSSAVPVVLVTSQPSASLELDLASVGAVAVLHKPLPDGVLAAAVARALG